MDRWNKKRKKRRLVRGRVRGAKLLEDLIECCDGKSNPIKFFSADQILEATDNFSESSRNAYDWYSGKTENHHMILIKKVMFYSLEEPCRDIVISSMVSGHKNFLKLVGCCLESHYPAVVYDGVKKHYELDVREQPWKRRMNIVEDIATALAYLHTAFPRPFVYRNLYNDNIFLDEDGVAKLWDFSYCISIPEGEISVKVDDDFVGTYDYMDDNYAQNGIVSEKTDVFAIGIVMQKFLSGKERFHKLCVETMSGRNVPIRMVPEWLSRAMEERRMEEIADPKMLEEMGEISEEERCQMKAFLMLSQSCIGLRAEVPTMVEVAKKLRKIQRSF